MPPKRGKPTSSTKGLTSSSTSSTASTPASRRTPQNKSSKSTKKQANGGNANNSSANSTGTRSTPATTNTLDRFFVTPKQPASALKKKGNELVVDGVVDLTDSPVTRNMGMSPSDPSTPLIGTDDISNDHPELSSGSDHQLIKKRELNATLEGQHGARTPKKAKLDQNVPESILSAGKPSQLADYHKEEQIASIRNGAVIFSERKLSLWKHPVAIAELAAFHSWMVSFAKDGQENPIQEHHEDTVRPLVTAPEIVTEIPDRFHKLVAMLAQDSHLTLTHLVSEIKSMLWPSDFEEGPLPIGRDDIKSSDPDSEILSAFSSSATEDVWSIQADISFDAIVQAVKSVAKRQNYGVVGISSGNLFGKSDDNDNEKEDTVEGMTSMVEDSDENIEDMTSPLGIYRWEVQDDAHFLDLPRRVLDVVKRRRQRRLEAHKYLMNLYRKDSSAFVYHGSDAQQTPLASKKKSEPTPLSSSYSVGSAGSKNKGKAIVFAIDCNADEVTDGAEIGAKTMMVLDDSMDLDGTAGHNAGTDSGVCSTRSSPSDRPSTSLTTTTHTPLKTPARRSSHDGNSETKKLDPNKEAEKKEKAAMKTAEKERKAAEKAAEKEKKEAERRAAKEAKEAEKKATRDAKEAEKKKKEDEKRRKEEAQTRILGFFSKIKSNDDAVVPAQKKDPSTQAFHDLFPPFHVKTHVTVAPHNRFWREVTADESKTFDVNIMRVLSAPRAEDGTDEDSLMEVDEGSELREYRDLEDLRTELIHTSKVGREKYNKTALEAAKAKRNSQTLKKTSGPTRTSKSADDDEQDLDDDSSSIQLDDEDDDGMVILDNDDDTSMTVGRRRDTRDDAEEDEDPFATVRGLKWKLLQFAENYRPAYYGTWRKRSKIINGRRPFAKDPVLLDYDVDSEEEWEEEDPGEELCSEDENDDEEGMDVEEDEDQDEFLVPHGYLSDDERGGEDADDEEENHGEERKKDTGAKGKEPRRRRILQPLVPVIVGPIFHNDTEEEPVQMSSRLVNLFDNLEVRVILQTPGPINPFQVPTRKPIEPTTSSNISGSAKTQLGHVSATPGTGPANVVSGGSSKKMAFPDSQLHELAQAIQGSSQGMTKMVDMLKEKFPNVSKTQLEIKIKEIAVKEKRDSDTKPVWYLKNPALLQAPLATPNKAPTIVDLLNSSPRNNTPTKTGGLADCASSSSSSSKTVALGPSAPNGAAVSKSPSIATFKSPEGFVTPTSMQVTPKSTTPQPNSAKMDSQNTSKNGSFDFETLGKRLSEPIQDESYAMLGDPLFMAQICEMPLSLVSRICQVSSSPNIKSTIRSRCLRSLGNYAFALSQQKPLSNERSDSKQEESTCRERLDGILKDPSFVACIQNNLALSSENGVSSTIVKNTIRFLLYLSQARDTMSEDSAEILIKHASGEWLELLFENLKGAAAEVAGYCAALIQFVAENAEIEQGKLGKAVDIMVDQLHQTEIDQKGGRDRDKRAGVKKYTLKMLKGLMEKPVFKELMIANTSMSTKETKSLEVRCRKDAMIDALKHFIASAKTTDAMTASAEPADIA
ncbi:Chromatin assembly factor 1, subunit A, partial [Quaeritorhiza haematococci]